ncbi:hypothetical protein SAMN05444920_112315 [Nonomuraea solani]|uniref:Uncharacterized protein n=1 Tax=Nonomuraea solani TaxID=1144553 RepID=A0A1H6EN28_9ACTN|nr:hypothetical protein [Nonomuraea solani]SEG99248.1 hypothetical protein SAMN05444920_112315 [Nonomuraea solani]
MNPTQDVAGKNAFSWRQRALAYIAELQSQLDGYNDGSAPARGAQRHLDAAREAAAAEPSLKGAWSGLAVDRTWANINKVEVALLKLIPDMELPWWGSDVLARALQHLGPQDPRRAKLEEHLGGQDGKLSPQDRTLAVITLQAANIAAQQEKVRLRSFRNTILISTAVMAVVALALSVVGALHPQAIKLCFNDPSTGPACPIGRLPSPWDVAIVELVGLSAASLVGAIGLRHIHGTSAPYTLPIVLALLKLPAGAVSAVIGLMLIQARFVPGLSELDTSAQILGWAALFGAAQQLITRLVDEQGQNVLRNVRDSSRGVDNP